MTMPLRTIARRRLPAVAAFALGIALASGAQAADPKIIGSFGAWTAYTYAEGSGKVCYMASQPEKAEGDYSRRGDVFALITHRPKEKSLNVISIVAGYPYKKGSDVSLSVDGKEYALFTHGERAWARDSQTDAAIATAIRKGSRMVVKGTSSRGTVTTDTYSLRGSSAALDAISKACGVN